MLVSVSAKGGGNGRTRTLRTPIEAGAFPGADVELLLNREGSESRPGYDGPCPFLSGPEA